MLITRSNARATRTSVSAVTNNRVIGEGVDHTAGADQHAVASVAVDHVLIDGRARNTGVAGITRTHTVLAVHRDLTIPNASTANNDNPIRINKKLSRIFISGSPAPSK